MHDLVIGLFINRYEFGLHITATAAMHRQLPYRPVDDFTMIGMISDYPLVIVTHSEYPFRSIADLVAISAARATPLTFGTPGVGSIPHLLGELLMRKANIRSNTCLIAAVRQRSPISLASTSI